MNRSLHIIVALFIASSAVLAEDSQERQPSRYTYRSIETGTVDDLAQPRVPVGKVRVVKAEPLVGEARRTTSTDSTSASNLTGSAGGVAKAAQSAPRAMTAPVQFTPAVRAATFAAQEETAGVSNALPDRTLVDRNAQFVRAYHEAYPSAERYQAATVVEPDPVQYASAAGYSPRVIYGNTYGTHSPTYYHGRVVYGSYANYHTGYYRPRTYVSSSYCAPTYYPTHYTSYSTYHYPRYSYGSYCSTPSFYVRPSFSIGYSWGGHRGHHGHHGYHGGSRFGIGFSFGW